MDLRAVIYWVVSIVTFVVCLLYPYPARHEPAESPLNLAAYLDVEPRFLFYADNQFNARVIGSLRIDIELDKIPVDISQYNILVIEDLDHAPDTLISLNWQTDEIQQQQMINKTSHSITQVNFPQDPKTPISDLHLLIEANTELGNQLNLQQILKFKTLYFDSSENHSTLSMHHSEWTDNTPIKFNSINGYTSGQDPHLQGLIKRLMIWVLVCVLAYVMTRTKGQYLLMTLSSAWFITALFYVSNHIKQNQQIATAFDPSYTAINPLDQQAIETASSIKDVLNQNLNEPGSIKHLVLIGPNDFFTLRLMHYLFEYNIALTMQFERTLSTAEPTMAFILINQAHKYCQDHEQYPWLNNQVTLLVNNNQYCIMRKQ